MADRSLELLKGTLDVLILRTVSDGRLHGYAISKAILQASGEVFDVEEGALYPALRRLEQKGLLAGSWGRTETGRDARFYKLTTAGRERLVVEEQNWELYVEAMGRVLGTRPRRRS
jgi:PadR family transcriptional regulator PadR